MSSDQEPQKPTVALLAHRIVKTGGMENACWELVRRGSQDISFVIVASELSPDLRTLVKEWVPINIPERPAPLRFMIFFWRAALALRHLEADLVHTVGAIVPNRADLATVHFCHAEFREVTASRIFKSLLSFRELNSAIAHRVALSAERWCYKTSRLKAFAAVSRGLGCELMEHYGDVPVDVIPNGVDAKRFRKDLDMRAQLRAEMSVTSEEIVVLFVGGDWRRKGLDLAFDALGLARSLGVELTLWVIGAGNRRIYERRAMDDGLSVCFFGIRPDTERFYQSADIFLLPSLYEAFSLVSLEAAASGLPLIMTPVNGTSELIGNNEAGLITERNPASIGSALMLLARNPKLRSALGNEARARATNFSWEGNVKATLTLYGRLLTESPSERPSR